MDRLIKSLGIFRDALSAYVKSSFPASRDADGRLQGPTTEVSVYQGTPQTLKPNGDAVGQGTLEIEDGGGRGGRGRGDESGGALSFLQLPEILQQTEPVTKDQAIIKVEDSGDLSTVVVSVVATALVGIIVWVALVQYLRSPDATRRNDFTRKKQVLDMISNTVSDGIRRQKQMTTLDRHQRRHRLKTRNQQMKAERPRPNIFSFLRFDRTSNTQQERPYYGDRIPTSKPGLPFASDRLPISQQEWTSSSHIPTERPVHAYYNWIQKSLNPKRPITYKRVSEPFGEKLYKPSERPITYTRVPQSNDGDAHSPFAWMNFRYSSTSPGPSYYNTPDHSFDQRPQPVPDQHQQGSNEISDLRYNTIYNTYHQTNAEHDQHQNHNRLPPLEDQPKYTSQWQTNRLPSEQTKHPYSTDGDLPITQHERPPLTHHITKYLQESSTVVDRPYYYNDSKRQNTKLSQLKTRRPTLPSYVSVGRPFRRPNRLRIPSLSPPSPAPQPVNDRPSNNEGYFEIRPAGTFEGETEDPRHPYDPNSDFDYYEFPEFGKKINVEYMDQVQSDSVVHVKNDTSNPVRHIPIFHVIRDYNSYRNKHYVGDYSRRVPILSKRNESDYTFGISSIIDSYRKNKDGKNDRSKETESKTTRQKGLLHNHALHHRVPQRPSKVKYKDKSTRSEDSQDIKTNPNNQGKCSEENTEGEDEEVAAQTTEGSTKDAPETEDPFAGYGPGIPVAWKPNPGNPHGKVTSAESI